METAAGADPAPAAPGHRSSPGASRRLALTGLTALALVSVFLSAGFASAGSKVVLATAGGSPDWLLGPLRFAGLGLADGRLAGPLFYAGMWLAMLAYVVVLVNAAAVGPRLAIGSIAIVQLLFLLAPPLLSQDVFSYIAYARLDVVHSLNPYSHSPSDVPTDAVYAFAGSKDATSAYGPLFTISSLPLAKLPIATALWLMKIVTALATAFILAATWRCARLLGRDPIFPALFVGLNPLVGVHVVAGAHNDAIAIAFVMAACVALLAAAPGRAGALDTLAAAVKASAGVVLPFMIAGSRRWRAALAGALATGAGLLAAAVLAFGGKAFDAFILIGQNQERTSRWSLPARLADGIAALTGADAGSIVHFTRGAFAVALAVVLVALVRNSFRRRGERGQWLTAAGWATLALLIASAWLVPWYVIWLLPLAALSADRRLLGLSVALSAYMMVIAVPL